MKIIVSEKYEKMSKQAFELIMELTASNNAPLICTASGDSPAGLYKEMVQHFTQHPSAIANWHFVSLDEWVGLNESDNGSCSYHLNHQLFSPLKIDGQNVCFFNGRAENLEEECERIENYIQQQGPIHIAIVGLGLNGHVGMNEPGSQRELRSHVSDIDPQTQQVGQKYFTEKHELTKGITLGIASIMAAKHVIMMVSGQRKAAIVQQVLEGAISTTLPASILREHPSYFVMLDNDAASSIKQTNAVE